MAKAPSFKWELKKEKGIYRLFVNGIVKTNLRWKLVNGNPQAGYSVLIEPVGIGRVYCENDTIYEETTTGDLSKLYTHKA